MCGSAVVRRIKRKRESIRVTTAITLSERKTGLCILLLLACEELSCISNKFSFLGVAPALREREEPPDKSLAYIE